MQTQSDHEKNHIDRCYGETLFLSYQEHLSFSAN